MRILQVNKFSYPHGGTERHFLRLISELTSRGHNVKVLSTQLPKGEKRGIHPDCAFKEIDFARPFRSPLNFFRVLRNSFWNSSGRDQVRHFIKKWRPDIVHVHNVYHHLSASILEVFYEAEIPVILTVHDYHMINPLYVGSGWDAHNKLYIFPSDEEIIVNGLVQKSVAKSLFKVLSWHWEKRFYKKIHMFVCSSPEVATLVQKNYPENQVVYHDLPLEYFSFKRAPSHMILWVGRDDFGKGPDLLSLFAESLSDDWKIEAIGIDAREGNLKYGSHTRVHWRGVCTQHEVAEALSRAAFLIVPTRYPETFSLVTAEAIASGCPFIASDTPVLRYTARADQEGISPFGILAPPPMHPRDIGIWIDIIHTAINKGIPFDREKALSLQNERTWASYSTWIEHIYEKSL